MNDLTVTEYKDIRVLTTQQIAEAYGTNSDVISKNFKNNESRYKEGKHFICLTGDELREVKANGNIYGLPMNANKFYLWTEKGCFLHAKSLGTDKAWEVYENLVDFYFNKKKAMTTAEQIKLLAQGNTELNERVEKVEDKIYSLENDMPLYGCEIEEVSKHVKRKAVDVLGGKDSESYRDKSVRSQIFSDIYMQIKREYGLVSSYKSIKRKYIADVHDFIDRYEPPMVLDELIADTNAQMRIV